MKEAHSHNIALLTAGRDKHYAVGMATAFLEAGIAFEFLGSDDVDDPALRNNPLVVFHDIRGSQAEDAPLLAKVVRILRYYYRLIRYAVTAKPRVFHILWNNKFEWFDRTILMVIYRINGRRVVLTAHNVNMGERDGNDSFFNRLTLRIQYRLAHAILVHTNKMRQEMQNTFAVTPDKIKVMPYPLNSTTPTTNLSSSEARRRLGLHTEDRVLLFYGNIAAYKGLEYLLRALPLLQSGTAQYRLLIAGRVKKDADAYWNGIAKMIEEVSSSVIARIEYIPDDDTEVYFKAADALVLPYTHIFQSGPLFLSYNYGLPVLAADVGSLKESIVEGETGFVCRPKDPVDLARTIQRYFESDLYRELPSRRQRIRDFAIDLHSWARATSIISQVYRQVMSHTQEHPLQDSLQ